MFTGQYFLLLHHFPTGNVKASPSEVEVFQIPLGDSANYFLLLCFNVKKEKTINQNKVAKVGHFVNYKEMLISFWKIMLMYSGFFVKIKLKALTLVSKYIGAHGVEG